MKVPRTTKAVIAIAASGGLFTLVVAIVGLLRHPFPNGNQVGEFAALCALIGATWVWPLVMYRDDQSEGLNLDEGFFIILALLLPGGAVVLAFALSTTIAQVLRRRPPMKSIFNSGQVVISAGVGIVVARLLAAPTSRLTIAEVAAATAGAVAFSIVNSSTMAAIVVSLGTPWRRALDGWAIRLRLVGSCIAVGVVTSLAISAYRWSWPLALLPLVVLRQVLAGHFEARHDRARMLGLYQAALEANRSLGEREIDGAILQAARRLLRCPDAAVKTVPPGPHELGASMFVNDAPAWLVVSGRSRTEPFDTADMALLDALAAVSAGALTNGVLYRDGRLQRERLAAITSSLGEGVCALDPAGRLTFVNPAAARMLDRQALPLSVSREQPATPEFLLAPGLQVMASRETLRRDSTDFRRDDGTLLPVALTASVILDQDEVAGAVLVFRDISESREVDTAIRVARDQAIEASRLKSQFLANMSHEIRTPMNGVLGMSRMLLENNTDEAQREYLEAIRDSGEDLMVIINDILDFSKIEAGKLDLEEIDFDLGASLASVTNAVAVPAQEKGLIVTLDVDGQVPARVRGDPVRVRQILTNLIGNAIKFTPAGKVSISAVVTGSGRVRISVTDTGIGIDPGVRETVLGVFGQADSSTTRRYGGTGLGLAICSQLVGMMGGVLDFTSQPGKGSTFWFDVPFAQPLAVHDVKPASVRASATAPPVAGAVVRIKAEANRVHVLVVDDNTVNQLVAARILESLGHRVDVVANGLEALEALTHVHYGALLMDCQMPEMDGYEATREIRRREGSERHTPIIAMTAGAMKSDEDRARAAGMDDYVSKPISTAVLTEALERCCSQR